MICNIAMDIDALPFSSRYFFPGFEQGDLFVRSTDSLIFALDSCLVMTAAGYIPFDYLYSLIPGIADLHYDSATLCWVFNFIRCAEYSAIENLHFHQLKCIASAANTFGFHSLQILCRLALRCFKNQYPKEILMLAVECGYHSLLPTLAGTDLIDVPLASLEDILKDPSIYRAWSLFRDHRIAALDCVKGHHATVHAGPNCVTWASEAATTYLKLERPSMMDPSRIRQAFEPRGNLPACCLSALECWRKDAEEIVQNLPTFSVILF
ncbi:hypothetical protein BT96DRAFT_1026752 [Gymnopus androsaceus JB14]|uniref:BTB domain-containing protein n=1 Tax=Gymnopus androsaceus JB14 TaxID=1447944 RepID=A0A6A4GHB7_9AGAR|nr:hypothetical protein BT96DRAFT_1026752 [Gymnopus androsaceus JB14]